ncbi:MAG: tRNA3(Ser)-specific nuclease WapA [Firmicutes bacterium]|nr:tRNA3(Ser)-specific nuclease WapA [candidate division NPL-UPA2 bacterium]
MRTRLVAMVLVVVMFFTSTPLHVFAEGFGLDTTAKSNSRVPQIVGEVTEKREQNVKHFLRDDFTYEATVYPVSVHYKENGQWQDIDNALEKQLTADGTSVYANKKNSYSVKVAETAKAAKLVRIEKDGYELAWGLDRAGTAVAKTSLSSVPAGLSANEQRKALPKLSSQVEFKNVAPGVDLRYFIEPEEVKEYIVLNQKIANPNFTFTVYTKDLTAKLMEDKTILFLASDSGKEVFRMAAPFMVDTASAFSTDIDLSFTKTAQGYSLTIQPNTVWLNAPERVYPVMIDPTVKTSLDPTKIYDNHVSSNYPTTNYMLSYLFRVGWGAVSGINRGYIKFDLPTLTTADLVVAADLTLYLTNANAHNAQVNAHQVTAAWDTNTINWNNKPSFDSRIEDYQIISEVGFYNWDITGIAKKWYTTGANNGLMLKTINDESQGYSFVNEFYSSDVSQSYAAYRPQVAISYINNSGLESFWTYHAQSAGRAGTGYVNDYNGNLVFVHDTLALSGSKLPLAIRHIFNSNERNLPVDKQVPGLGAGWRLNLSQRIETQIIDGTLYYVYTDEDGTKHFFSNLVGGIGRNELDGELTIELLADGTRSIADKKGNKLLFNSSGLLTTIQDSNNNTMTLSYTAATTKMPIMLSLTACSSTKRSLARATPTTQQVT